MLWACRMMNVVLIDNYDSFTYNLAHCIRGMVGVDLQIILSDASDPETVAGFDCIIISPGPGLPRTSGFILDVIRAYSGQKPILGICLGLQAICEAFYGQLMLLPTVSHGVSSDIRILDPLDPLFKGIESPFKAGRYHSWVCDTKQMPDVLRITAVDDEGHIMALRHERHPTYGVQFHPESILTPKGEDIIRNFLIYG